jgi:hypothetical protein
MVEIKLEFFFWYIIMCECSSIKQNICEAAVYNVVAVAAKEKHDRKMMLFDFIAVAGGGEVYDKFFSDMWEDNMMKDWGKMITQLAALILADMAQGNKVKIAEVIPDALYLLVARYGLDALGKMEY